MIMKKTGLVPINVSDMTQVGFALELTYIASACSLAVSQVKKKACVRCINGIQNIDNNACILEGKIKFT